ncbi:outer membrane lipoprotein-sorting protein [Prolixibacter bellariivorans]|uniref:Outer membrane lipoprotein-sorting protein n=1 Tax=Prolixibacter bellariivorans TaxID=314319 RepID=A0A5M4B0E1_9BACT|nr:outer membrane lipoprotein-sorting protein [Prolixibacter bellariivorans]GET33524.1 outer membrane lipoprotein-sorting protein [Prolixibacter bellariivorans]
MKTQQVLVFLLVMAFGSLTAKAQDAKEIVNKANDLLRGQSSESVMTMKIIRPKWERTLQFKSWSKGTEYSLIYVLAPAKEKGQVFLKRGKEIWNWVPSIERMIKIPPSMMMQSWMGSDLTNDDLVKESSIVEDYNHKIIGEEKINGYNCYKIEMIPKEDAAVVWGKIITWISKEHYYTLKNEYYDEDGYLINEETLSKIKKMGDRTLPTYFEMVPVDKKGHKTTMEFNNVKFDMPIKDSFFSIQNMKRVH